MHREIEAKSKQRANIDFANIDFGGYSKINIYPDARGGFIYAIFTRKTKTNP